MKCHICADYGSYVLSGRVKRCECGQPDMTKRNVAIARAERAFLRAAWRYYRECTKEFVRGGTLLPAGHRFDQAGHRLLAAKKKARKT